MKMRKVFAVLLALVLLLTAPAIALGKIDTAREVRLTVSFQDGGERLAGAQFDIYRVAKVNSRGSLSVVSPFTRYNVNLDIDSESAMGRVASTLEGYVLRDKLEPAATAVTNRSGNAYFTAANGGLPQGLYLVIGRRYTHNGMVYNIQPALVQLPSLNVEKTNWLYDVEIIPKYDTEPDTPESASITRKVLKVWDDGGRESKRPESVTVQLLCDGEVYDTVILNEENFWRHSWEELEAGRRWTVVETEMERYSVSVTLEGVTFVVTNSYEPEAPTPTPTPPPGSPSLPQTGQLWWPVPLLAAAGLLFIVIGLARRRGN